MAYSNKQSKTLLMKTGQRYPISRGLKNDKVAELEWAIEEAEKRVAPHVTNVASNHLFPFRGEAVFLASDAPTKATDAARFLLYAGMLAAATEAGDLETAVQYAYWVGYTLRETLATYRGGKSLEEVMEYYHHRIRKSEDGGEHEPVWGPVARDATRFFEKFKCAGFKDHQALLRTMTALTKHYQKRKNKPTVPRLTCLREHLVNKPKKLK